MLASELAFSDRPPSEPNARDRLGHGQCTRGGDSLRTDGRTAANARGLIEHQRVLYDVIADASEIEPGELYATYERRVEAENQADAPELPHQDGPLRSDRGRRQAPRSDLPGGRRGGRGELSTSRQSRTATVQRPGRTLLRSSVVVANTAAIERRRGEHRYGRASSRRTPLRSNVSASIRPKQLLERRQW